MIRLKSKLWSTTFDPLPDVTAWELARDKAHVNASDIVSSDRAEQIGSALRHRVNRDDGRRMDVVYAEWDAGRSALQREGE